MENIKLVTRTLMVVIILLFSSFIFHHYVEQTKANATESIPTLPDFEHTNNQQFLDNVCDCVNYIQYHGKYNINLKLLLAQSALESGWGNSRFAKEGHNLFGIRTYDLREPHMLPSNNPKKWGVRVYMHECDSVKHYMDILTNGKSYTKYRELINQGVNDPYKLIETLDAYASDKNYFSKIKNILSKIENEYIIKEIK